MTVLTFWDPNGWLPMGARSRSEETDGWETLV